MARLSPSVDKSGSKRKSNNEKEGDSNKRASCRIKTKCSEKFEEESAEEEEEEWEELNDEESEEEEEESNEVGDKAQDKQEADKTGKNRDSRRGNKDGEFNFRIDPDILDCSICFEPLRPPIFQCRNGHIACSYCCPKIRNKCHFCTQPIGRMRCIALEKIIESIKSPCQYTNYGCKAVPSFANKASHEEHCIHAALFCPITNCTFSGSQTLLFAHAGHNHPNISKNFSYDKPFMIGLEKQQCCLVLLGEDGYFFLLLNKNHETFAGNVVSVICIAPKGSKSEFLFEIRAESSESSLRLKTSAEKMRMWNGVHLSKTFLVVPDCFYGNSNAQLSIVVCIRKA